ncbi:MAG TPA: hypothetical protein VI159_10925 [Gemmatimonadales bacterium]
MWMMTSAVLSPFANCLVPIMIGARRMAFPRIEAIRGFPDVAPP